MDCFKQEIKTWNLDMETIQTISGLMEEMVNSSSKKFRKEKRRYAIKVILDSDPLRKYDF